jgi:Rieske Fe-S protein
MTQKLVTLATVGVMTSALLWSTGTSAQPAPKGGPQAQPVPTIDAQGSTLVDGKVLVVERDGNAGTILRLDNGMRLVVNGAREEPRTGDEVRATYVETGGEKVVKFLRVIRSPGL